MNQEEPKSKYPGMPFPLKPYTVKQLSELYGISKKTLLRWMSPFDSEIGEKQGYFYNISQVKCIVKHLGIPGSAVAN